MHRNFSRAERDAAREAAKEHKVQDVFGAFKDSSSDAVVYGVHYADCVGAADEYMWQPLELPEERGFDADFQKVKVFMLWKDQRRTKGRLEKHKAVIGKQDNDGSHSIIYKDLADSNIYMDLSTLKNLNADSRPQPVVGWVKSGYINHLPPWLN